MPFSLILPQPARVNMKRRHQSQFAEPPRTFERSQKKSRQTKAPVWERQRRRGSAAVLRLLLLIYLRDEYSAVTHHRRQSEATRFCLRDTRKRKRHVVKSMPNCYLSREDHSVALDSNLGGLEAPQNSPRSVLRQERAHRKPGDPPQPPPQVWGFLGALNFRLRSS